MNRMQFIFFHKVWCELLSVFWRTGQPQIWSEKLFAIIPRLWQWEITFLILKLGKRTDDIWRGAFAVSPSCIDPRIDFYVFYHVDWIYWIAFFIFANAK